MLEYVGNAFTQGLNGLWVCLAIVGALVLLGFVGWLVVKICKSDMHVALKIVLVVLITAVLAVIYYFDILLIIHCLKSAQWIV